MAFYGHQLVATATIVTVRTDPCVVREVMFAPFTVLARSRLDTGNVGRLSVCDFNWFPLCSNILQGCWIGSMLGFPKRLSHPVWTSVDYLDKFACCKCHQISNYSWVFQTINQGKLHFPELLSSLYLWVMKPTSRVHHHHHQSFKRPVAHRASTSPLHSCQSFASHEACLKVRFRAWSSASAFLPQVDFGCPLFLLPSGVHLRASLEMLVDSLWSITMREGSGLVFYCRHRELFDFLLFLSLYSIHISGTEEFSCMITVLAFLLLAGGELASDNYPLLLQSLHLVWPIWIWQESGVPYPVLRFKLLVPCVFVGRGLNMCKGLDDSLGWYLGGLCDRWFCCNSRIWRLFICGDCRNITILWRIIW